MNSFRLYSLSLMLAFVLAMVVGPGAQARSSAARIAAAAYDYDMDIFHPVVASHGMVATEQALASKVGLEVLKSGGNAVDAAVAIGFALVVVLPNAGNLGGGGFMMFHEAGTGRTRALDFREVAPAIASRDMYLDEQGKVLDGRSLFSHQAVGVPGTVAGLLHALEHWGSQSREHLLEPAIRLAEQGVAVSQTLAQALRQSKTCMASRPATKAIFWRNDRPLEAGETLVQKDLANSLRRIVRDGAKAFYEGEIGQRIAFDMAEHGGLVTLEDLKGYRVIEREPLRGSYRGHEILTMPPPSSGGVHLLQLLNIMERWPIGDWGHNSARSMHQMVEAMKLAYADRAKYLGDPDFVQVPQKGLISKDYAESLAQRIDPDRARPATEIEAGQPMPWESDQTTHYSVVDGQGNMVAVTYTLNTNFGSCIVAPGTGILLNNEMDDFSLKPGVPNVYGVTGGEANAIAPGKRPLSSMTPTLVLKDVKPFLVTGSPGGPRIITTVLQQISNAIDHDLNPAEAASAPRFHHQLLPDELRVEKGFSPDTLELLRAKGHNILIRPRMGSVQTIQVRDGQLQGWSDPRTPDGETLGY